MFDTSTTPTNSPINLWIDAQTVILPIHEDLLDTVLSSVCGDDLILRLFPILSIQDITENERVILAIAFSKVDLGWDGCGNMLIFDENSFEDIENTVGRLGLDVGISRLTIADIAVRDAKTLETLNRELAKHPAELPCGLHV